MRKRSWRTRRGDQRQGLSPAGGLDALPAIRHRAHVRRQSIVSTIEVSDHLASLGFRQALRLGRFYTRAEAILTAIDTSGCALN